MTPEEIIAMATEAGLNSYRIAPSEAVAVWKRFAALVAAKERDACCAPAITNSAHISAADLPHVVVQKYQASIRARGQKEGA